MTEEEKYQITGKTVHELKDTEKHLACLQAQAESMLNDIKLIIPLLEGEKTASFKEGKFHIETRPSSGVSYEQAAWPSGEKIDEITQDIIKTQEKIGRLRNYLDRI